MRSIGLLAIILLFGCTDELSAPYTFGDRSRQADGVVGDGTAHDGASGDPSIVDGGYGGDDTGDGSVRGDEELCPPCAPPPSPNCVGSGPCGCGPYECPGDTDLICGTNTVGWCPGGVSCECCPAGGPTVSCLCTAPCTSDDDCTDPERPVCNQASTGVAGMCTAAEFFCCWMCQ